MRGKGYTTRTPLVDLRQHRKFNQARDQVGHPPVIRGLELSRIIEDAAGVDVVTADRILRAITSAMAAAIRDNPDHPHVAFRDLGTFRRRRHHYGTRWKKNLWGTTIHFDPHPSWHAPWMPVLAYDAAGRPVGIYNGPQIILPWDHPDNPYPGPDDVPLQPERHWQRATPLPGRTKKPRRSPEWDVLKDPDLTARPLKPDTPKRT